MADSVKFICTNIFIMTDTLTTLARGLLMLRLPPLLMPRPTPCMVMDTMDTPTTATPPGPTMVATGSASDLLMLRLPLLLPPKLMPRPTPGMDTTDGDTQATATDTQAGAVTTGTGEGSRS